MMTSLPDEPALVDGPQCLRVVGVPHRPPDLGEQLAQVPPPRQLVAVAGAVVHTQLPQDLLDLVIIVQIRRI